jgi:RNA 3'-terminal phosphate cyclase (ATP)
MTNHGDHVHHHAAIDATTHSYRYRDPLRPGELARMLQIDGTDGGGQVLRTALSLAAITETPVRVTNVRGARPTPGLRAQHRTAVKLVADCCDATVEGAELGADEVRFDPGDDWTRSLSVDVGTAGSITLLFDTILPIAAAVDESFEVVATGGTDVRWAPTVEYLRRVKLPLLAGFGVEASVDLSKTGFYPAGGGRATLRTGRSTLTPTTLDDRGPLERVEVYAKAAETLANRTVAERQASRVSDLLTDLGYPVADPEIEYVPTRSPGTSLLLCGVYENSLLGVDELGAKGVTSEAVADAAVGRFDSLDASQAPVDRHMADQLLVFLALAGGRLCIPQVTDHVRTNLDVLAAFGSDISLTERDGDLPVVTASPLVEPSAR